jgi:LmbE family N-acetylglucosaminyl deacetylase
MAMEDEKIKNSQDSLGAVLAVGAHPDDVEISCAGTLKLLRNIGYEIHIATMTLGDCGSAVHSAEEIRKIRRREAEAAAAMLPARYYYAGSHDFSIFHDDVHNRCVTALVRAVSPVLVLTHPPHDYITDHEITSMLVRNACFYAPARNYVTPALSQAGQISAIPHLYYRDSMEGVDIFGRPTPVSRLVDITEQIDFKSNMLACHKSQREWLRQHHGMDEYIESMRAWGASRGAMAARLSNRPIRFAEAFQQHLGHAYPHTDLLAEVLGRYSVTAEA